MTMELTKAERSSLGRIKAELDLLRAQYTQRIQALMKEDAEITREVEARLGLPERAIGETHALDWQTWTIEETHTFTETAGKHSGKLTGDAS